MAEEAEDDESLEAFANRCACKGETFIAVVTAMRFSDAFYAQWTVMNVPFCRLADLNFDGLEKVPENFQGFAMALHHAPDFPLFLFSLFPFFFPFFPSVFPFPFSLSSIISSFLPLSLLSLLSSFSSFSLFPSLIFSFSLFFL